MYDVITIGSATRDVLLKANDFEIRKHADSPTGVEQCFPLGSKLEVEEIVFTTGGGGTNAAVTFARQGLKTACVSVVGKDSAGEAVLDELKKEEVETKFFQKHDDKHTAYSVILVHPDAERTILSYKGEGQHFDVKLVPFEELKARWFYLDSMGGHYDLLEAAVSYAIKNEIKIAFNPGGRELAHGWSKLEPILKNIDIFLANKEEAVQLVGADPDNLDEVLSRLAAVVKDVVLISDGHNGVMARSKNVKYKAGVPNSPIIERTGAGDAFGSGFISEYIRSGEIKKAIQFGTANASSVVTKFGAKAGILKKGDWGPWPLVEVYEVVKSL